MEDAPSRIPRGNGALFFRADPRFFGGDARFFAADPPFFGADPRFFGTDSRFFGDPPEAAGGGVTRLLHRRP
jgi:hypothetical protein